jgi:hypothetical protein
MRERARRRSNCNLLRRLLLRRRRRVDGLLLRRRRGINRVLEVLLWRRHAAAAAAAASSLVHVCQHGLERADSAIEHLLALLWCVPARLDLTYASPRLAAQLRACRRRRFAAAARALTQVHDEHVHKVQGRHGARTFSSFSGAESETGARWLSRTRPPSSSWMRLLITSTRHASGAARVAPSALPAR